MGHTCCISSALQLVQSHLHACAYISVLFSDLKENKKTERASQTSSNPCPFQHWHMPNGAFSELIVCYQQMPCNHTHSLYGDAVTAQKVHVTPPSWAHKNRSCCSCRKLRLLSNKCTFRADRRLSRCSPVSVYKCLSYVYCVKHHVDEWCQNLVVNLKHCGVASMFVVLL